MSNRKTTRLSAQERHRASGNERPFTTRWQMLSQLMLRNDLTHAEHRLLYLLYAIRANSQTGVCFTTDARAAEDLGLTVRTIERTKASLKAKGLLDWTTDRLRGRNDVTVYNLNTDASVERIPTHASQPPDAHVAQTPTPASAVLSIEQLNGTRADIVGGACPFYAKDGSPELDAWDRHNRLTRGKGLPRDRTGGWLVPSQWPPTPQLSLAETFDL